ncbi:MAG: hypothetical protein HFJ54_06010 [Clostridia bacterium]|nr:hypothetical protein [Clostridia bacterium]
MKKYIIIVITICLLMLILSVNTYQVQAVGLDKLGDSNSYIKDNGDNSKVVDIGNVIVGVVRTVGESIAVVMLAVIGIKYVMGSVEEKAEYKQTMWPYILGAALIFAGSALTNIIYELLNS